MEGDPGAGKTTLALQFLLEGLRVGQRGSYRTLSATADDLEDIPASHGWPLNGIDLVELKFAFRTPGRGIRLYRLSPVGRGAR